MAVQQNPDQEGDDDHPDHLGREVPAHLADQYIAQDGPLCIHQRASLPLREEFNQPSPQSASPLRSGITNNWQRAKLSDFFMDYRYDPSYAGHAAHRATGYNLLAFSGSVTWMPDPKKEVINMPTCWPGYRTLRYGNGQIFAIFDNYLGK